MLVDSHCHLDFPEYEGELDEVVARARSAGVGAMVTISTVLDRAARLREIAGRYDGVWCSVGVHPHEAEHHPDVTAAELVGLSAPPEVVAIGESGLDYYYEHSPRDAQRRLFREHINAARQVGLPVIVHTRAADKDTVAILREAMTEAPFTGLIHCFSTSRWLAEQAVDLGLYVSIAGIVTFKNAEDLRETAAALPLDRLLLETDAPYLAPAPKRGKRNEPAFMVHTAGRIAELRGIEPEDLAAATTGNFFRLFTRCTRPQEAA
jgi:TatD DNase family protein